ncbi:MAG: GNAT family protein [Acidimicrobiales bacterium]
MVQLAQPITTSRLVLRRPRLEDLDDFVLIFEREDVTRYLYWEPRDRDTTLEILRTRVERSQELEKENVIHVAIERRAQPGVIGDFMLRWEENEHRQGETGGSLHPDFHGLGYAAEIYGALLVLAFEKYHLHRVVGRCDGRNTASIRSLEKAGFHQEARLVENEFVKGEWTDEVIMALRRDEWEREHRTR